MYRAGVGASRKMVRLTKSPGDSVSQHDVVQTKKRGTGRLAQPLALSCPFPYSRAGPLTKVGILNDNIDDQGHARGDWQRVLTDH
jgi:hypothetical protein